MTDGTESVSDQAGRITPTIADAARIDATYAESDQRKYHLPCPHCGVMLVPRWAQVKWPPQKPAEAWYECELCHQQIADHRKPDGRIAGGRGGRR